MSLETETSVDSIETVTDKNGESVRPANLTAQGDFDQLRGVQYSTSGTTEESLDSYEVPVGAEVMVVYDRTNAGTVYVGPSGNTVIPLAAAGDFFVSQVNDTSEIAVLTPNAGDAVHLIWEDV
jgi:hypothetical protein